jgi:hypothetical protein
VPKEALDTVRGLYADPADPVFTWIPLRFKEHISHFYSQHLQSTQITRENAWDCYHILLNCFKRLAQEGQLPRELQVQGYIQETLLIASDSGSHRGDEWGYGGLDGETPVLIGSVEVEEGEDDDETSIPIVLEEDTTTDVENSGASRTGSENDDPLVDFSRDEDEDIVDDAFD